MVLGLRFGTFAASGADSYGYVSQADLWLIVEEPLADQAEWRNANWTRPRRLSGSYGGIALPRCGALRARAARGRGDPLQPAQRLRSYANRITMRFEWLDPDMYVEALDEVQRLGRPVLRRARRLGATASGSGYAKATALSRFDAPPLLRAPRRVYSYQVVPAGAARSTGYN